jgi:serine/threonine protein kinase
MPVKRPEPPQDDVARKLWDLWRAGQQPNLQSFLDGAGDLPLDRLAAILRVDQHERWRTSEAIAAESYLQRFPVLKNKPEALGLIFDEILLRQERGETVPIDEYYRRFPEYAERIWERARTQKEASEESLRYLASREQRPIAAAAGDGTHPAPVNGAEVFDGLQIAQVKSFVAPGVQQRESTVTKKFGSGSNTPVLRSMGPEPGLVPAIPGYEILEELGRGGMGVVYKARQISLKRIVALKMIRAVELAEAHELARFKAEAEAAAQLQHPNIVQIYEVGEYAGQPYFSLEYVDGGSLSDHLRTELPSTDDAAAILVELAEAIHFAHVKGIIHRDLKPGNVLIGTTEKTENTEKKGKKRGPASVYSKSSAVKITDFGLAKQLADQSGRTTSGTVVGSPSYMPPEQAKGEIDRIGPRSDVYSLGAILYEMLTGRPPFRAATAVETMAQVAAQEPVAPGRLQPRLPRDLETICLKCLEKDPQKRYASAKSLAADLERFREGKPIMARPVSVFERSWRWCRRNPAVAALTGGLAAVILISLVTMTALYFRAESQRKLTAASELKARKEERIAAARLADHSNNVALFMYNSGQFSQAEASYRQAIDIRTKLAAEYPNDPDHRREQAVALNNLANLLKDTGRSADAEAAYREALALLEKLNQELPNDPQVRRALAACLNNWANQLTEEGRLDDAKSSFQRALELQERLVAETPTDQLFTYELGNSYANYGLMLTDAGKPKEAMAWLDKGIARLQAVLDQNSRQTTAQQFLSLAHANRARALVKLNRASESINDWDQAILLNDGVKRPQFRAERIQALAKSGDYTKAAADLDALARRRNLTTGALYEMARAAALCSPSAGERYATSAMDWLTDIAALDYFKRPRTVEMLKSEADFTALKKRTDFQALLKGLTRR